MILEKIINKEEYKNDIEFYSIFKILIVICKIFLWPLNIFFIVINHQIYKQKSKIYEEYFERLEKELYANGSEEK